MQYNTVQDDVINFDWTALLQNCVKHCKSCRKISCIFKIIQFPHVQKILRIFSVSHITTLQTLICNSLIHVILTTKRYICPFHRYHRLQKNYFQYNVYIANQGYSYLRILNLAPSTMQISGK